MKEFKLKDVLPKDTILVDTLSHDEKAMLIMQIAILGTQFVQAKHHELSVVQLVLSKCVAAGKVHEFVAVVVGMAQLLGVVDEDLVGFLSKIANDAASTPTTFDKDAFERAMRGAS